MSYLHGSQFRNTTRSSLNVERSLSIYSFGISFLNSKPSVNEFICPDLEYYYGESYRSRTTCLLCESKGFGRGCKDIKGCEAYNEEKNFEKQFPNIDWNTLIGSKEELIKADFVKKGCLRLPVEEAKTEKAD